MDEFTFSLTSDKRPAFTEPLPVGQLYLPPRDAFRETFDKIFERRFFTNHGPLVNELDKAIAAHLNVEHAVCVTNGTVALMVACSALELTGSVIVPSFTFPATVQALVWAGLQPIFCDIDPVSHCICPTEARKLIRDDTSAILGVHVWGRPCNITELNQLAEECDIKLFFDACHAFGVSHKGKFIGNFGELEIFSFHATKIMSAGEGGCITTNDAHTASRLRTIRNFHSAHSEVRDTLRINGKMTEAQAGMALLSLEELPARIENNRKTWVSYKNSLSSIPGISMVHFDPNEKQNYQYLVLQIDKEKYGLSRDQLLKLLNAENILARRYFYPAVHQLDPFKSNTVISLPNTERLCEEVLQLPLGAMTSPDSADVISNIIYQAHIKANDLNEIIS